MQNFDICWLMPMMWLLIAGIVVASLRTQNIKFADLEVSIADYSYGIGNLFVYFIFTDNSGFNVGKMQNSQLERIFEIVIPDMPQRLKAAAF